MLPRVKGGISTHATCSIQPLIMHIINWKEHAYILNVRKFRMLLVFWLSLRPYALFDFLIMFWDWQGAECL